MLATQPDGNPVMTATTVEFVAPTDTDDSSPNGAALENDLFGEAPYGRRADGTPKGKPGPKGPRKSAPSPVGIAAPRPTKTSTPRKTRSVPVAVDYRAGVLGMTQLVAAPLALAGRINPAFAYDSLTISRYAPALAEAANNLAQQEPAVAAALDKVLQVGPYGEIIGVALVMAVQMMVNHGKVSHEAVAGMGIVKPEELIPA